MNYVMYFAIKVCEKKRKDFKYILSNLENSLKERSNSKSIINGKGIPQ